MSTNYNSPSPAQNQAPLRNYEANITEYPIRNNVGVCYARSTTEIQQILAQAHHKEHKVYPISTGRNWGLGSALPVTDDNLVLSLEKMNQIRMVNPRLRFAIIEPGVTQQALYDYLELHHPELSFPMTGSGTETSIVGNILERGVCVRGHRYPYLLGLEVVLAQGRIIRTGQWHQQAHTENSRIVYSPGVGPDLNGLFTQSNLGVVSAMVIQLEKKQPRRIMSLIAPESQLEVLADTLFSLREEGVLQDGLLLTVYQDPRTSAGKKLDRGQWFASASLSGSEGMQEAGMLYARQKLESLSDQLHFYKSEWIPEHTEPAYLVTIARMYRGEPSNYGLESMARLGGVNLDGQFEIDPNKDVIGFVCALPVIPFQGSIITKVIAEIDLLSDKMGVKPFYNFVGMTPTALEGFFRVFFNRYDEDAIARAQVWNQRVHTLLAEQNLFPYRINVEQMQSLFTENSSDFWKTIVELKQTLDPNHIISPGRYCPLG